ncbi:MAG: hypothetical protein WC342_10385 [Methanoregula sp.]
MTRGPRPHRALPEAIPIAKARGIVQLALSGPERVSSTSNRIEGPGRVRPDHVRAGDPRDHPAACQ